MHGLLKWIHDVVTTPAFQWASFGVGFVGTWLAILAWRDSRRKDRVHEYLFKTAEKNIDKDVTEATLEAKRKEVRQVSDNIEALQRRIEQEIPIEAKRTVLKDRLDLSTKALQDTLASTLLLKRELEALGESSQIPPDLLQAVEAEIRPEYVINAQRESLKTYLTIVMTTSAVLSAMLPYEIRVVLQFPLILIGIAILVRLIKLHIPRSWGPEHAVMWRNLAAFLALCWAAAIGFAVVLGSLWRASPNDVKPSAIAAIIVILLLVAVLFGIWALRSWRKAKALARLQDSPS